MPRAVDAIWSAEQCRQERLRRSRRSAVTLKWVWGSGDANAKSQKHRPDCGPSLSSHAGHLSDRLLIGTFVSDLVYLWLGDAFWARVSFWLLAAGIAMALLAALAGLIDFLGDRSIRAIQIVWFHMIGNVTAVVLSLISLWFRCRDG